jgi:hypothetical protein
MFSPLPAGNRARIDPQSPGQVLLGQAPEPAEGDYWLAEAVQYRRLDRNLFA